MPDAKIISVFNNKGGVGKSTLTYHLGNALAEMGKRVLLVDLDPQCNLTICAMMEEQLHEMWTEEDPFITDFESAFKKNPSVLDRTRTIHFLLKPTEDGMSERATLSPPLQIEKNLDMLPGRLSLHKFENRLAERWSGLYLGDNLSIRTVTNIRFICQRYSRQYNYDYILIDTSPSLGILNKTIISTVDAFFIPAQPDMFSLYGIRNIGGALKLWQREFDAIYNLISREKRKDFPEGVVQFLGYTIYNAKKYSRNQGSGNQYNLAEAHYQYANQIPNVILEFIPEVNRKIESSDLSKPIGGEAIIHSHNTFPAMAQALKSPMWKVPEAYSRLEITNPDYIKQIRENGFRYNPGNNGRLREIGKHYIEFTEDLLTRIDKIKTT